VAHRIRGLEVGYQLELGWLFNWDVGYLDAPEKFDDLLGYHLYEEVTKARSVGGKSAFLRLFGKYVHRRQA